MTKDFKLRPDQIQKLVPDLPGCIASDRITVDGAPIGFMIREAPSNPQDSGWLFVAGDEDDAYMAEPERLNVYSVNTIANYDPSILPFLYALPGQQFERDQLTGEFLETPESQPDPTHANLPPGMAVVQGEIPVGDRWSIELPTPFRQRHDGESLVLWRIGLTLWLRTQTIKAIVTSRDRIEELKAEVEARGNATDLQMNARGKLVRLTYRVVEPQAVAPSLNAYIASPRGDLVVGIYFDREDELVAANAILNTISDR